MSDGSLKSSLLSLRDQRDGLAVQPWLKRSGSSVGDLHEEIRLGCYRVARSEGGNFVHQGGNE